MQLNGRELCDFCFSEIEPGMPCENCRLTHEKYKVIQDVLPPGTNLMGKYILGRLLGRGGFGATYQAYSAEKNGVVAVKEYLPVSVVHRAPGKDSVKLVSEDKRALFDQGAKVFYEEAKTLFGFNKNSSTVTVYEYFCTNNTMYYSMEYLDGADLKRYIAWHGGKLGEEETIRVTKGICKALLFVHSMHMLHLDLSPGNVFVCRDGKVKLIDFGVQKHQKGKKEDEIVVVKRGFAPAEQYADTEKKNVRTDIYAVGAIMYYCLTGKVPPDAITRVENPVLDFGENVNISEGVRKIVLKCMETEMKNRYQSVVELKEQLDEVLAQGSFAEDVWNADFSGAMNNDFYMESGEGADDEPEMRTEIPASALPKKNRTRSKVIALCAVVLFVAIVGAVVYFLGGGNDEGENADGGLTCTICGSTEHGVYNHPKCTVCGKPDCDASRHCTVCGSTEHTKHPTCPVCGSTEHTKHPTCPVCGSTDHTKHPACPVCGSTDHTVHPKEKDPGTKGNVIEQPDEKKPVEEKPVEEEPACGICGGSHNEAVCPNG